jgi:hypothetical protein
MHITKTVLESSIAFNSILFNISFCQASLFENYALSFNKINLFGRKGGIINILTWNKVFNTYLDLSVPIVPVTP